MRSTVSSLFFVAAILLHAMPNEDTGVAAFRPAAVTSAPTTVRPQLVTQLDAAVPSEIEKNSATASRREVLRSTIFASVAGGFAALNAGAGAANAAERPPLDDLLYRILRVREATQQESRLIKSGKFKDVQRANVKLAVKFILDNYRLSDAFVAASAYLDGNQRRTEAAQVGQAAVQNLYTILEYFDSSDVQNIKISSSGGLDGKEELVLKGLEATRKSVDDFLAFYPKSAVDPVKERIQKENELNVKEFDPSLGTIVNMPTLT